MIIPDTMHLFSAMMPSSLPTSRGIGVKLGHALNAETGLLAIAVLRPPFRGLSPKNDRPGVHGAPVTHCFYVSWQQKREIAVMVSLGDQGFQHWQAACGNPP